MDQLARWQQLIARDFPNGADVLWPEEKGDPLYAKELSITQMMSPFSPHLVLKFPTMDKNGVVEDKNISVSISTYEYVSKEPLAVKIGFVDSERTVILRRFTPSQSEELQPVAQESDPVTDSDLSGDISSQPVVEVSSDIATPSDDAVPEQAEATS